MAKEFSDNDMRTFSDFLARLPAAAAAGRTGAGPHAVRPSLITQHRCNSCHDLDLSDARRSAHLESARGFSGEDAARIPGQHCHGYDGVMASVLAPVSDAEIADLAYYVALSLSDIGTR